MLRKPLIAATPILILAGILALGGWFARPEPTRALGTIIIVDATDDATDNDGTCSLREAILAANINGMADSCGPGTGADAIRFILSGTPTINISSPLPAITDTVHIGNTGGARVELHGPGTGDGLTLNTGAAGSSIRNLVINNFGDSGVYIAADNVTITGSFIGTNADGTSAVPNARGVYVGGGANAHIGSTNGVTPGGACTGDCNVISGNGTDVYLSSGDQPVVQGNFIGTDVAGSASLGGGGIHNQTANALIGGTATGAGNLITYMDTYSNPVTIQGNRIGTNSAGTAAILNSGGLYLNQAHKIVGNVVVGSSIVGGAAPGAGNLISGNTGTGIDIYDSLNVNIQGNLIGTAANGADPIPNSLDGIWFRSGPLIGPNGSKNGVVGGISAGQGNTIAFNGRDGVRVDGQFPPVTGNVIRANSIFSNAGKGIENVNGGNAELTPPAITAVGSASGTACANCTIDVYSDAADEGKTYEGSTTADGSGNWSFSGAVSGPNVTATATDANGNTSEFSAPFTLPATPTPTPSLTPSPTPTATPTPTPTATPTPSATSTGGPTPTHTATPTPTHTPTPTPVGQTSTPGVQLVWGNVDCKGGGADSVDALQDLRFVARLGVNQALGCPGIETVVEVVGASPHKWGDVNCDGGADSVDALRILRNVARLPDAPIAGCPVIGTMYEVR